MLTLIQIINYMLTDWHSDETPVRRCFQGIEEGQYTLEEMVETLGLEINPTMLGMAREKFVKWPSALAVVKMRLEK